MKWSTAKSRLAEFVTGLQSKAFNGRSAPQVVLVSPIANENVEGVAAADRNNARIKAYGDAIRDVAKRREVGFVNHAARNHFARGDARAPELATALIIRSGVSNMESATATTRGLGTGRTR